MRGLMVYGTSAARWRECLSESTARQLHLRGVHGEEIARRLEKLRAQIGVEALFGRSAAYHRQLDQLDHAGSWRRADAPVMVLRGEHDWVVGSDEQAAIAEIVEEHHPGTATLCDLAGLDHWLGRHASEAQSVAALGSGVFDPAIVEVTVAWMRDRMVPWGR